MKGTLKVLLILFSLSSGTRWVRAQQKLPLYVDTIPLAKVTTDTPRITVYRPNTDKKKKIAVIVCSGGSYGGRANHVEGIPACKKLSEAGITAFLLDYRLPKEAKMFHKERVPLTDAQRAIQYVREHAKEYHIDPHQIGMMGFSAGGHLVSTAGTHFGSTLLSNPEGTSLRPDFMALIYPVISFADSLTHSVSRQNLIGPDLSPGRISYYSNELQVTDDTPPTYITHGIDDKLVKVTNSLYFSAALRQHHVPVELFLYEKGKHGYGVDNKQAKVQWIDDCIQWILRQNWKPAALTK